jgi:gliding motility-associated-like protein
MKTLKLIMLIIAGFISLQNIHGQICTSVADWESEMVDEPLQMSAQFGGYYAVSGTPFFVEENCTPEGMFGLRLKAGIDGAVGDVVGYTESFGFNPPPTFFDGVTYNISGKKLYSNLFIGTYTNLVMTITLVNGMGSVEVVNKSLMLVQGDCWDPPQAFVSPGDFELAEITITADNGAGEDELFIIIDDWCIEEVPSSCFGEFEIQQLDNCGKYQFFPQIDGGTFSSWVINGPGGFTDSSNDENLCYTLPNNGVFTINLLVICEGGTQQSFDQPIEYFNVPPVFEACTDNAPTILQGVTSDGECIVEYTIPDFLPFVDGMFTVTCFLDSTISVTVGQVVPLSGGTHTLFCIVEDECGNNNTCLIDIEVECEGDEPCDYICCVDGPNWSIGDIPLGPLPNSFQSGLYPEWGTPVVIEDGCESNTKSIELNGTIAGTSGDIVGIKDGGFGGPINIFEEGKTYCISFCMKAIEGMGVTGGVLSMFGSTSTQSNATCTGICEVIGNSTFVDASDGWTQHQYIYTPTGTYEHFLMQNNNTGVMVTPPKLRIDNICITENPEPVACQVGIFIEEQECGKVIVNTDICGELEEIVILYDDGYESFEVADTTACINYSSAGPWTVTVNYICAGETTIQTVSQTFTLENKINAPEITCPGDTLINLDPEGECVADVILGSYIVDDPSAIVQCYISGILVANPSLPVQIPVGFAQVEYIATNECGTDTCTYEIEVTCETIGKYDCPIDFLFIIDNSGSVDGGEYANMKTSAMNEIAAISGTYTNSKFGVIHYSGQCGANISIEHDFQPASSITAINRQFSTIYSGFMDDLNESLDATINALNGAVDADIVSPITALNQDPAADLYIVIFTDAFDGSSQTGMGGCTNSALKPYTNANILKNTFGANISLVHFVPGNADDVGAAIASAGGNYTGLVDANPGDPDNLVLPRQFIAAPFGVPALDLLDILPPCEVCFDCDDLEITLESTDEEACCYSIDINNGIGTDIVKLEAEILSPDWDFNSTQTNPGLGFTYTTGTVPTNKKVCISDGGGQIPAGVSLDVLEYCFSSTVPSPAPLQTMVFRWYSYNGEFYELECTDTLITECTGPIDDPCITVIPEVNCNPDNAYVYDINLTITNNSPNPATHVSLNGLPLGYQFASCTSFSGTNNIGIPIPGGLGAGATKTICVRIIAPIPILLPQNICFDAGIYSFMGECCHEPTPVCVTLDKCCDPCEDISVSFNPLTLPGQDQCCYEIVLDYDCDYLYFNKIKFSSQTTGVTFGFHALSNTNFQMCGSSATELCIEPTSGLLSKGSYGAVLDICMDGITDPSQVPQIIKIDYLVSDPVTNLDTVACSDEASLDCEIFTDNKCLEVTNQSLICLPDSMKYLYTFDVTNLSTIAFSATDVTVFVISPSDLEIVPSGGVFPLSPTLGTNQTQTVSTCIESKTSTFPATATELILGYRLSYLAGDTCCYESVLDTIQIPTCDTLPSDCFTVVDIEAKNVNCESTDCYANPFCLPWLVAEISSLDCVGIATASVEKAFYNGLPVFVTRSSYLDLSVIAIYDCDGDLLQKCYFSISPSPCSPDAGISIGTDLTSKQTIWTCGDPLPVYDPVACSSTGGLMSVDYCVKIMNNTSSGQASQIDLQALLPIGMNINPSTIPINLPSGGMTTLAFTATGSLMPGDTVKIKGTMFGNYMDDMEYMCMDTLCLPVPDCPQDSCCVDENAFFNNISLGFQVTQLGDCTYEVCANQFDTCHYFGDLAPDWGDGTVTIPQIIQSNPPNNCWQYTYSTSGTYTIKLHVYEGNPADNESCWDADLIAIVEPDCCTDDPCEMTNISSSPVSQSQDSCCYDYTIDNGFCEDYFKGIKITVQAPVSISQIQSLNGYVITQISPAEAEVRPALGNLIPLGVQTVFRLCNTGFTTNPHSITVSWLVPLPSGGCEEVCSQDFEVECDIIDDDPKCYSFVEDSIHCESKTYCFKIKNESMPGFDINSVHLYDLTGSLILSPSGRIGIPTLPQGQISDWICVQYNGVNPGDNVCYKLSAHNTPIGLPPTQCCTDTIETCFVIPECPVETCGLCPDGSVGGQNLITNGDFESGYTGFTSGYVQTNSGLLSSNRYSIRNSTNLVNTQWAAIDHTIGSSTGSFAVFDGPSANVAYRTAVTLQQNTDYVFCAWVDNLVTTSVPSAPVLRISVGSLVIEPGRLLPKTPDGWQLMTYTFNSGTNSSVNLDIRDIGGGQYNDWAMDDLSLRACGPIVDLCCDDLDEQAIIDYYNANINVVNNECEGCVTVDIDSCDLAYVNFGSGEIPMMDLVQICQDDLATGTYTFTIRIERLNAAGEVCFEETFQKSFDIICPPVDDCCDDLDEQAICDYYDINIVIANGDCEGCVTVDLDSCDIAEVDFGNGPVSIADGETRCQSFTTGGSYSFSVKITRLNINGDPCFEKTFDLVFDIEGCVPDPDPCCDNLDIAALDAYYLSNTTFDTSNCAACVIVDLDSCDVGTITFSGGTAQPLQDNTQACMTYTASGNYSYIIDVVRYNTNGDTCYHYQNNQTFDLVCDDDPPVYPCVQVVADSIDCETNTYCFRVRNNTVPGWTIRSLAFVNESVGHTLTPDPISITPLVVGDTTDWICIDYIALFGDTVCFNLVAHQEDLGAGDEPEFCCSNPEPVCFVVPDCEQCTMCPDSTAQGPNLVMNSDFEGGYTGFTSDHTQVLAGILGSDEYSIRNSTNLINGQWVAVDHTTGTPNGNFLVVDGPSSNVGYRTTVPVKPNTQYVFCVFVNNLIVPLSTESTPTLEIVIDGVVINPGGQLIPRGDWWIISLPYSSGTTFGMVDIEISDINTSGFNDWAIDDVSFRECMIEKVCCEDEELFNDLLDIGWTVSQNGCTVTVSAPQIDSCHWLSQSEPDWGDGSIAGQVITSATGTWNHTYSLGGVFTICATIYEGDNPDDLCFSGEMCTEIDLIGCEPIPCNTTGITIFNAMTPNGDGLNDRLVINGGDDCTKNIKIFNRWGQEVWAQLNYQNDWTGESFSGEKLPAGTYFLVLEFPEETDDKFRMKQTYIELRN